MPSQLGRAPTIRAGSGCGGSTDWPTRVTGGDNPFIFGVEFAAVLAGAVVFCGWIRLIRTDISDEMRIRSLWLGLVGCAMLFATTLTYFVSEVRAGFADIGQGLYGLLFKFIGMNIASIVFPAVVLYAIYLQVDYLTRRSGVREALAAR